MKTKLLGFGLTTLLFICATNAQVGVGNTNPQAQLDISASNTTSPANNDGILIPRMSAFPSAPGATRDGMLIFYTGTGADGKGFYYWNQTTTSWEKIASGGKNTLDEAYDEGGVGNGRIITADNGAVQIDGDDGFQVIGIHDSGNTISLSGGGTRMFFNPRKSAFRAGRITGLQWDDVNVGAFSTAFGTNTVANGISSTAFGQNSRATNNNSTAFGINTEANGSSSTAFGSSTEANGFASTAYGWNTEASGDRSTAFGVLTIASGNFSTAFGFSTQAFSYGETSLGMYTTSYTPTSTSNFSGADRILSVGNGQSNASRSNALTIYKSGLMNINDEYNMPLTDGSANQVMATDGAGQVSFVDPSSLINDDVDWYEEGTTDAPDNINDNIFTQGRVAIGTNSTNNNYNITSESLSGNTQVLIGNRSNAVPGAEIEVTGAGTDGLRINLAGAQNSSDRYAVEAEVFGGLTSKFGFLNQAPANALVGQRNDMTMGGFYTYRGMHNLFSGTSTNPALTHHGIYNYSTASISGRFRGIENRILGGNGGNKTGLYNFFGNNAGGFLVGHDMTVSPSNNTASYIAGLSVSIPSTVTATNQYGIYSDVTRANGYSGYFLGRVSIGTTTSNNYILPGTRGNNGYVIQSTGGTGTTWADPTSLGTDDQNIQNLAFNTSTNVLTVGIEDGSSQTVNLSTLDNTGNDWSISGNTGTNPSTNFIGTIDNQDLAFRTNNIEKVRITAKGQIETTQLQSVWIGENAGNSVTSGQRNVFIGRLAGTAVTTGVDNTALGALTLSNLSGGQDNTALGLGALLNLSSGNGNTFVGEQSGENLATGNFNTVIGHMAGENMNGSSNIFIGYEAGQTMTGNNKLVIDNDNNGTGSFIYGEMDNEILRANAQMEITRNSNGTTTSHLDLIETDADDGSRLRFSNSVETDNTWTIYGRADDTEANSRINFFFSNAPGNNNIMQIFGDNEVTINGRLGVNLNGPAYAIHLPNNAAIGTGRGLANAWVTYSDKRVKSNQQQLENGLFLVNQMTPKTYFHHDGTFENGILSITNNGEQTLGFIAQELYEVLPEAVQKPEDENQSLWSVNYDKVIPVTVKAIQELNTKIETLEAENKSLKQQLNKLEQLEARLLSLENNTNNNSAVNNASRTAE